jgi:hypothetical protein
MTDTIRDIRCYVLVRNDLPSLNAGKATAHTHHAGVQMVAKYMDHPIVRNYIEDGVAAGADHFNTTISLGASLEQIDIIIQMATGLGYVADRIMDPTYPFFVDAEDVPLMDPSKAVVTTVRSDGKVLMTRPETTCGYVLGYADDPVFRALVGGLKLMP